MHTKNIPGSHVIIKCAGVEVPDSTLLEGAMLAAYFSKGRMSSQVPVDYTMKKHVKKPSGSKPGMVIYETNNTIYVTPEEEVISKLRSSFLFLKHKLPRYINPTPISTVTNIDEIGGIV